MPSPPAVLVLGVDPGTRVAGWGVIACEGNRARLVGCGVVRTKGPEMGDRLAQLHAGLLDVIDRHRPAAMALEQPFLGRNPRTAFSIGMARAVALLAGAERSVPAREFTPAMVKKAVVGNGNASKEQVAAMVRVILGVPEIPGPADATDALAVALAHFHRRTPDPVARGR